MKKLLNITFIFLILIAAISTLAQAGIFQDKIDKAKKLSELEGYKAEVSNLLEQAILEDPMDATIHFRAGEVYEKIGYTGNAYRCYRNSIKIDSSYKHKVVQKYFDKAKDSLSKGKFAISKRLFDVAIEFSPDYQPEVERKYFIFGEKYINEGKLKEGSDCFRISLSYQLGRLANGRIFDYANVIAKSDEILINKARQNILKNRKIPLLVITMPSIGDEIIENYVSSIYNAWNANNTTKTIMFICIKERKVRIQQGSSLMELGITDEFCGKVLDLMVPYFRKHEFGKGLHNGILAMIDVLNKDNKAQGTAH